ncbi:hypothetical protein NGRA_0526 [Nosema granulosis]|uniref:Uncharacterized protein n=1 Tax=Nosema granulosis TaxID=83296 RepID=A0A9P6KZH7_9MICR|nr:hypothetical protein NGRA_0526 [Nosema granulosis]
MPSFIEELKAKQLEKPKLCTNTKIKESHYDTPKSNKIILNKDGTHHYDTPKSNKGILNKDGTHHYDTPKSNKSILNKDGTHHYDTPTVSTQYNPRIYENYPPSIVESHTYLKMDRNNEENDSDFSSEHIYESFENTRLQTEEHSIINIEDSKAENGVMIFNVGDDPNRKIMVVNGALLSSMPQSSCDNQTKSKSSWHLLKVFFISILFIFLYIIGIVICLREPKYTTKVSIGGIIISFASLIIYISIMSFLFCRQITINK